MKPSTTIAAARRMLAIAALVFPALCAGQSAWTAKAPMPTARHEPSAVTIGGLIYAAAGYSGGHINVLEAYDPATNNWSTKAPRPDVGTSKAHGVINNILYEAGGTNCCVAVNSVFAYDPATNSWASKTSMPTARQRPIAGVINGKLYVAGGLDPSGARNKLEVYDPATNAWNTLAAMPTARYGSGGGVINGLFYVVGGALTGGADTSVLEVYDPATNSWTTRTSMPTARSNLATEVLNGILYAIGGTVSKETVFLTTVEAYDPATNTWSSKPSLLTARGYPRAVAVGGTLYVMGGYNGVELASMEAYAPLAPDTQAPTVPSGLTAIAASASQIDLTWTASTDSIGVTSYKVYRNGTLVGGPSGASYQDTGLSASASYSYTVAACDAAGNCSAQSAAVTITTASTSGTEAAESGSLEYLTITANFVADAQLQGQTGSIYVVAQTPDGNLYAFNGSAWTLWDGGTMPAYYSGALSNRSVTLLRNENLSNAAHLEGAAIYLGHGRSQQEMISTRRYGQVYVFHMYSATRIQLTASAAPAAGGTVTSTDARINCGATCTSIYAARTQVTLTANPASGWQFGGWSGACTGTGNCTVTMDRTKSVTATFTQPPPPRFALTVTPAQNGGGSVSSSDANINCGSSCTANYTAGTRVTLTANPASGWLFSSWTGACAGSGSCTLTINTATNVGVTFSPVTPPTTLAFVPPAPPLGAVGIPYNNFTFSGAGTPTGGNPPYHFQLDSGYVLPPGLTLHPSGVLDGTPTNAGNYSFSVCAVDLSGSSKCGVVGLTIVDAANPYQGNHNGRWTGTCPGFGNVAVNGVLNITIGNDNGVNGNYQGTDNAERGVIGGETNRGGDFFAKGTGAGGINWYGKFAVTNAGAVTGRGTWDDGGDCNGTWTVP